VVAGALGLVATGAFFLAANAGLLTVAAVLSSLYPGVTVLLAAALLHERPDHRQVLGLCIGAASVVLVAVG
jgi:drug/metabolite transporter (DMT)-like permease